MIFLSLLAMTFVFTLYATLHRLMGLNWPKDWGALTFGIRTMKVWLRLSLSSNDAVVKAFFLLKLNLLTLFPSTSGSGRKKA